MPSSRSRRRACRLALGGLLLAAAALAEWGRAAEVVTFQLARSLKKPDVVYVLTNDSEARQLGLNDTGEAQKKITDSIVGGAAAPPPPVREEPPAPKPGDSAACRQIREQGCLVVFPGMEHFAYFVVLQMGPADAGGCVTVTFYPGNTPEQARHLAESAMRMGGQQSVPMKVVFGPASYQAVMDYARRLCREKSGTDKAVQMPQR